MTYYWMNPHFIRLTDLALVTNKIKISFLNLANLSSVTNLKPTASLKRMLLLETLLWFTLKNTKMKVLWKISCMFKTNSEKGPPQWKPRTFYQNRKESHSKKGTPLCRSKRLLQKFLLEFKQTKTPSDSMLITPRCKMILTLLERETLWILETH